MKSFKIYFFLLLLASVLSSCEQGLDPTSIKKGIIRGTIKYSNDWFPDTTVKDIRVVAFKNFPPTDMINEVLSGNAVFSESVLPFFGDSANFVMEIIDLPVKFKYIAVARQYGTLFEWDAIGVYSNDNIDFTPIELEVKKGSEHNIIINVDFNHLPPQPF